MADYGVRITLAAASPAPTYTAGPWVSGVASLSSSSSAAGWTSGILVEVSAPGEQVDIASGGNYASVSDVDVVLFAGWVPAFEAAGASMYGATVEVGTLSGTTLTVRWSGVVSDLGWRGSEYRITAESLITLRHREIPARILSSDEFAGLASDAEGRVVPAIYGANERLTPASLQSERDYLAALRVQTGANPVAMFRSSTMIAQPYGGAAPTATIVPIVFDILTGVTDYVPPDDYTDLPWWLATGNVYMEIYEGTGSGQRRKISGAPGIGYATVGADYFTWSNVELASPLDVLPTETSGIRFYAEASGAVLVVGDEAVPSSVTVEVGGTVYPIGFSPGSVEDVTTADVSAEFVNGEDYSALSYVRPSNVYGVTALSDGLTASGATMRPFLPLSSPTVPSTPEYRLFDCLCRGTLYTQDIPDSVLSESATIYAMFAVDSASTLGYEVLVLGERWTQTPGIGGSCDQLQAFATFPIQTDAVSTYSSAILSDGTPGNFASFALEVASLPVPLRAYRRLDFCLVPVDTVSPTRLIDEGVTLSWPQGSNTFDVGAIGATALGRKVRKTIGTVYSSYGLMESQGMVATRPSDRQCFGGMPGDWLTVTNVVSLGGGQYRLTVDGVNPMVDTGGYYLLFADASDLIDGTEYECGVAFSFGSIPQDSQFLVNTSSGRTFDTHWTSLPAGVSNGDPITKAAHIAQDIFLRDLAIPQASIGASYLALPAYTARMALVDQEDSASILARMCREFNWIGSHDNAGRETLVAWLENLYALSADYTVANADIVADSITGVDATSLDDIVTLPRVSWDWTQADGFRGAGTVTDCSAAPSTITPTNYLRTISGFGDYSTALSAYETLHEAWKRNGVRRSESIEYRYGGNPTDLYLPARLEWTASRKDILQFKLNETHAAASAYLGQRISVTHKRYTGGGTVYGTLVARYWFPADGHIQLTVMLDPVDITAGDDLYVDTLDPTATIEQYTDEFDGVSEQYTDTLGA